MSKSYYKITLLIYLCFYFFLFCLMVKQDAYDINGELRICEAITLSIISLLIAPIVYVFPICASFILARILYEQKRQLQNSPKPRFEYPTAPQKLSLFSNRFYSGVLELPQKRRNLFVAWILSFAVIPTGFIADLFSFETFYIVLSLLLLIIVGLTYLYSKTISFISILLAYIFYLFQVHLIFYSLPC